MVAREPTGGIDLLVAAVDLIVPTLVQESKAGGKHSLLRSLSSVLPSNGRFGTPELNRGGRRHRLCFDDEHAPVVM